MTFQQGIRGLLCLALCSWAAGALAEEGSGTVVDAQYQRVYNQDMPGRRLVLYQNDTLSKPASGGMRHGEKVRVLEHKALATTNDREACMLTRVQCGKQEGWVETKYLLDEKKYRAHPVPVTYYVFHTLDFIVLFLGAGCGLACLIGVILRLLRSGEYVSRDTFALIVGLTVGGLVGMLLCFYLVLGTPLKQYLG